MELKIDDLLCDLCPGRIAIPGFDARHLGDPGKARTGRSLRLRLPATRRNNAVLRYARDPFAAEGFNHTLHRAALRAEGALLLAGTVRLTGASAEGYEIEIRDGGAAWADRAALKRLAELEIDCSCTLTPTAIEAGWQECGTVEFLPVVRDAYPEQSDPADLQPDRRVLTPDDYHPFLHVATLVERIFAEAGYRLRSDFFSTEEFRSLYMSGTWGGRDTAALERRMGFRAGRRDAATAAADALGRVYADPNAVAATVGNVVDTAAAGATDAAGEPIAGLYDNGGCLATDAAGRICFTPTTAIAAGFEYDLRLTTDHRIRDRQRLTGFDGVYLGTGADIRFTLPNRYEDRRGALAAGRSYRAIVFDHAAGRSYRLTATVAGTAGVVLAEFATRTAAVTTPAAGVPTAAVLLCRTGEGAWSPYGGDWALYDGFVAETGRSSVRLRVRTAAEELTPTAPKRFNGIYFHGAEEGMHLTLDARCTVRPLFSAAPGYGATVAATDLLPHGVRQAELVEALGHLFNLRFLTDGASRTVWVEPADDFYRGEVDWSGRTDFAHPVRMTDIALELHERRTWRYRDGDGAVTRLERAEGGRFGAWSTETASVAALQGEAEAVNPLFAATWSSTGDFAEAPSARVMHMGDRDAEEEEPLTPRIVRYAGLRPLPEGEHWSGTDYGTSYPLAAFHCAGDAPGERFTLCFGDRDGIEGLHRRYDRQTAVEQTRQRIELWLRIAPHEFEALFAPGLGEADLRSVFRIDTGQGTVRGVLRAIGDYDPEAASVRCVFTRIEEEGQR